MSKVIDFDAIQAIEEIIFKEGQQLRQIYESSWKVTRNDKLKSIIISKDVFTEADRLPVYFQKQIDLTKLKYVVFRQKVQIPLSEFSNINTRDPNVFLDDTAKALDNSTTRDMKLPRAFMYGIEYPFKVKVVVSNLVGKLRFNDQANIYLDLKQVGNDPNLFN